MSRHVLFHPIAQALAVLAVLVAADGRAVAQAPEASTERHSQLVIVAGNGEHVRAMAQLLEAIVEARRDDVQVVFIQHSESSPVIGTYSADVVIQLDTTDPKRWNLRLWHAGRSWRRNLEGGIERDAAVVEAAALISGRAALARMQAPAQSELRQWEAASEKPREPVRPETTPVKPISGLPAMDEPPSAPAAGSSSRSTRVALGYGASLFGNAPGPEGSARLRLTRIVGQWSIGASAAYGQSVRVEHSLGRFELRRTSLEGFVGFSWGSDARWLQPTLGCVLEAIDRSASVPAPGISATRDSRLWQVGVSPTVRVGQRLWHALGIGAGVGLDVFMKPPRFLSEDGVTLSSSSRVRPKAELFATIAF